MKYLVLLMLLCVSICAAQTQSFRVGVIDFFGTKGLDVDAVRAKLPLHVGDTITLGDHSFEGLSAKLKAAVQQTTGHPATDIAPVCCNDKGEDQIYIGLAGTNSRSITHLLEPRGSNCLPQAADELYQRAMNALTKAVEQGDIGEDDSRGYALSHNPDTRKAELEMRQFVVAHVAEIDAALRDCSSAENRRAASALLGYADRSPQQIAGLVRASNDSDSVVRNNAVRALEVLAVSASNVAKEIPLENLIPLLNSGQWTDRNKAGFLFVQATAARDPRLLSALAHQAFDSLAEMARWQDAPHAEPYRIILGRIAGLSEARIKQLVSHGGVEQIIAAAEKKR